MHEAENSLQTLIESGSCSCPEARYDHCNMECPHCVYYREVKGVCGTSGMRHISELIDEFMTDLIDRTEQQADRR